MMRRMSGFSIAFIIIFFTFVVPAAAQISLSDAYNTARSYITRPSSDGGRPARSESREARGGGGGSSDSRDPEYYRREAQAFQRMSQAGGLYASGRYEQALSMDMEAANLLPYESEALRQNICNDTMMIYVGQADQAFARGDYDRAAADLLDAMNVNPPYAAFYRGYRDVCLSFAQTEKALGPLEAGKYSEAQALLNRAVRFYPGNSVAYFFMGVLFDRQNKPGMAEVFYREALFRNPNDFMAQKGLGSALIVQNRPIEALDVCRRAVAMNQGDPGARENLGLLLSRLGRAAEAEAVFREGLRMNPRAAGLRSGLGQVLARQNRPAEAAAAFREALALDPRNADSLTGLADALANQKNYAGAAVQYRRALEIDPQNATVLEALGASLFAQGLNREARAAFLKAAEASPKDPNAYSSLFLAMRAEGLKAEASAVLQQGRKNGAFNISSKNPKARLDLINLVAGIQAGGLTESQKENSGLVFDVKGKQVTDWPDLNVPPVPPPVPVDPRALWPEKIKNDPKMIALLDNEKKIEDSCRTKLAVLAQKVREAEKKNDAKAVVKFQEQASAVVQDHQARKEENDRKVAKLFVDSAEADDDKKPEPEKKPGGEKK